MLTLTSAAENVGATITLEGLPRLPLDEWTWYDAVIVGSAPTAEQRPPKVLVVDDNEANRALARETLEDEGYEVGVARSGGEALAAFERDVPDCVLLDVRMPDLDGFAVCERIRATAAGAETPILFFTALRDVETFDRALRVGGDDFLTKPVRPTELVIRVNAALQLRRLRAEAREHFDLMKKQRDDLMRLQLQKERLMAFVVHDLKNPVNSMDLSAQLLLREAGGSPSTLEAAAQIRAEARHLTRMILNLLDLSKADEGKLEPKRSQVDVAQLVAQIFAELEVGAQARGVTLRSDVRCAHVEVDEDLLRRLLANLVENALRHAPSRTDVTVTVTAEGEAAEIRVADAGRGVPAELREKIFDPFIQLEDTRSGSRSGRGLGLTFSRLVAEAHGGTIRVEDASPGAVFVVTIPPAGSETGPATSSGRRG